MLEQTSCLGGNPLFFNVFLKASAVLREGYNWLVQEGLRRECCAVSQVCMTMCSLLLKLLLPVKGAGVTKSGQWACTFPLNSANDMGV